ncbi:MAG: hypothetical protein WA883_16500, partial [Phormidesmis sp.]
IFIVGAEGQVKERLRRFQVQATLPSSNFVPTCYEALVRSLALLGPVLEDTSEPFRTIPPTVSSESQA